MLEHKSGRGAGRKRRRNAGCRLRGLLLPCATSMAIFRTPNFISGGSEKKKAPDSRRSVPGVPGMRRGSPINSNWPKTSSSARSANTISPSACASVSATCSTRDRSRKPTPTWSRSICSNSAPRPAYKDRLAEYQKRTGLKDSAITGLARIEGRAVAVSALDFNFLGGTLGSVAGERITRNIETATDRGMPVIIVSAAGGARLHEGMFALMQMAENERRAGVPCAGAAAVHLGVDQPDDGRGDRQFRVVGRRDPRRAQGDDRFRGGRG